MKLLVTGAAGSIGRALGAGLPALGDDLAYVGGPHVTSDFVRSAF